MSSETTEAPMLSDERLAAIAEAAFWANDDGDQDDAAVGNWLAVARAVRAALTREHEAEDAARNAEIAALAVPERVLTGPRRLDDVIELYRSGDGWSAGLVRGPSSCTVAFGHGDTPATALLALAARLEDTDGQ